MVPQVEIFWNFFPFDLFWWWIVKMFLNVIFFLFWIPSIPFYEAWNVIPYMCTLAAWFALGFLGAFWMFAWFADIFVFLCFTYLYVTSMPISTPLIWMGVGLAIILGATLGALAAEGTI